MGRSIARSTRPWRRTRVRRRLLVEHLGDRRVLAAITGSVFEDANLSFRQDAQESLLASRLIYIDSNDNATIDAGERFVVAEEDGTFAFPGVADGTYLLRLFNGTQTQQQTVPIEATVAGEAVTVAGSGLLLTRGPTVTLTQQSVVLGDLNAGVSREISVASELTKVQSLPDGTLLVIGTDEGDDTSWIVDPISESATSIDLAGQGVPIEWSDVAIDRDGRGVLVERSDAMSAIRSIDTTDPVVGLQVLTTTTMVPSGTQVLASETGGRSVLAWSDSDGMQLSLWSNLTSTLITETPIIVAGTAEMLAYDDASGLLVMRTTDGGVSVHDVNQNFATLHSLPDVTGPVAISGARDLLMTVSPIDAMLRVIGMRDGATIADLAIDSSTVGQIASLAIDSESDAIVMLGATGMAKVALNKAGANRVKVENGQDVGSVLFGVSLRDANSSPQYTTLPDLTTDEDVGFTQPAPAALNGSQGSEGAVDAQGDRFVLIQSGQAANGVATISINGDISYAPDHDFFGTDTVPVMLHDGRDVSSVINLQINVSPTPDGPIGIDIHANPVPEHILPGTVVGGIEVIDVDLDGHHLIDIDDPRFEEVNGQIIFVGGDINFETDEQIWITIIATDPETGDEIDKIVMLTVIDENDPITAISPSAGIVTENVPGDFAVTLGAEDEDDSATHEFSVDDDRFVMVGADLRLAENVAVDFEETPEITVNVTATDGHGSSLTEAITIQVADVLEQPTGVYLVNDTVLELAPGDVVGEVSVDGAAADERFTLTVDDSRFEITDGTLRLVEDQFVERATQEEIQLTITVDDSDGEFDSVSDTFVILVVENQSPYHNDENPYDVDHNGNVTSLDALLIINYLNIYGPGPVGQGDPGFGYDVNGDGYVTALDALLILNEINRIHGTGGTVGQTKQSGEGEQGDEGEQTGGGDVSVDDEETLIEHNTGKPVSDLSGRAALEDLGVSPSRLPDQPLGDRGSQRVDSASVDGQHQEVGRRSLRAEEFAAGVDQTLRLLADQDAG